LFDLCTKIKNKAMKNLKGIVSILFLATLALALNSCLKNETREPQPTDIASTGVFSGFEFNTTKNVDVNINVLNQMNQPIDGVLVELYTHNPLDGSGQKDPLGSTRLFKGISDKRGRINYTLNLPTTADSLYVLVGYVGLPNLYTAAINSPSLDITVGGAGKEVERETSGTKDRKGMQVTPTMVNGYYVLGGWNSAGVPDYLMAQNDVVSNEFLAEVNATLPEYSRLNVTHPQYFTKDRSNHDLIDKCNVWVTFVHEGAGWTNALGYYTYPTNNPPASAADIKDKTIIFPNASYSNSGGGMASGNKVQLMYLDPNTNAYTDVFPAGVTIGWFLVASGWNSSAKTIGAGTYTDYSNDAFNVETTTSIKKHSVLLFDNARELFLLGFEDQRRDGGSDEDFNDAVFYTTVNPITAVDLAEYKPTDKPGDTDGDGVSDVFDEFPKDNTQAFNNYYPLKNATGTLVYEDLWPYKGDYDFNDLVIDYNFDQITDARNNVTGIRSKIVVRAIGATYRNAFAVSLNTLPSNVASVNGQKFTKNFFQLQANGTESGQTKAVIPVFDDAYNVLKYPGVGLGVNTVPENPYSSPDTIYLDVKFVNPVTVASLGTPPYNPFIIVDRVRGVEVHLPNNAPTSLADTKLLGTGQDNSNPSKSIYYVSETSLPWAINLPESFDYPSEKQDITTAHLMFTNWATTKGYSYMDWYQKKPGYRNTSEIYSKR
jgi:LruC domain-containing protein